ncbi:hypothetical protein ASPZODRAFT_402910 [Penicilliopsis zonata CBS 506.65]|uniref:Uncharacterized protein n=1 Tax=Penicilliopsis zonata CBS 506.65 TaxID=1073090 RepID=A0A1L9SWH4_9EURO|nr:hypothetical protein ASPZODRAFT_402910 [Penicilliopsis zonata CBS 506.65]OJJ51514.1 hypothetical protein ASPZODRAFT_402910 [Penicilliopsis zonata CBS 506.65]
MFPARLQAPLRRISPGLLTHSPRHVRLYANSSYGDGEPHPEQTSRATRDIEHPGPPPPDMKKPNTAKTETETGAQAKRETTPIPSNKAHPTLSNGWASPNIDEDGNHRADIPEDVKRHNAEMDQRHDKSYNSIGDSGKVEKKFWTEGEGR